jgi:hypothetical protein
MYVECMCVYASMYVCMTNALPTHRRFLTPPYMPRVLLYWLHIIAKATYTHTSALSTHIKKISHSDMCSEDIIFVGSISPPTCTQTQTQTQTQTHTHSNIITSAHQRLYANTNTESLIVVAAYHHHTHTQKHTHTYHRHHHACLKRFPAHARAESALVAATSQHQTYNHAQQQCHAFKQDFSPRYTCREYCCNSTQSCSRRALLPSPRRR